MGFLSKIETALAILASRPKKPWIYVKMLRLLHAKELAEQARLNVLLHYQSVLHPLIVAKLNNADANSALGLKAIFNSECQIVRDRCQEIIRVFTTDFLTCEDACEVYEEFSKAAMAIFQLNAGVKCKLLWLAESIKVIPYPPFFPERMSTMLDGNLLIADVKDAYVLIYHLIETMEEDNQNTYMERIRQVRVRYSNRHEWNEMRKSSAKEKNKEKKMKIFYGFLKPRCQETIKKCIDLIFDLCGIQAN